MKVKESTIDGAGLGTFATQFIPKNTDLGKYYGKITKEMPKDTTYAWTIFNSDKFGNIFKQFVIISIIFFADGTGVRHHPRSRRALRLVLGGIAEQTNLLALNAAIEAARADGAKGRGPLLGASDGAVVGLHNDN